MRLMANAPDPKMGYSHEGAGSSLTFGNWQFLTLDVDCPVGPSSHCDSTLAGTSPCPRSPEPHTTGRLRSSPIAGSATGKSSRRRTSPHRKPQPPVSHRIAPWGEKRDRSVFEAKGSEVREREGSDIDSLDNLHVISRDATHGANCSWCRWCFTS